MPNIRAIIVAVVLFALLGFGVAYYMKKDDIAAANQTLENDQVTLVQDQQRLVTEQELHKSYVTLARVYLKNRPSVEQVEERFNNLVSREAKRHGVKFPGAEFGSVNGSIPTPSPTGVPGQPGYVPQAVPTPLIVGIRGTTTDLGGKLPGDPNVGRPAIDPTLFVRIPVALRLSGRWRDVISTIQDITKDDVVMTVQNPSVANAAHSGVEIHIGLNLLDPALPLLSGFEREVNTSPDRIPVKSIGAAKHEPRSAKRRPRHIPPKGL